MLPESDPDNSATADSGFGAPIVFEDVGISFGGRTVLENLSCHVPAGEITVILGMSGAGKSVMMRLALGLMQPDRGRVIIDGHDLARASQPELLALRRQFGVAFQGGALFTALDVAGNIAFPMEEHTDLDSESIHERVSDLLRQVDLPHAAKLQVDELSGGMQKRVAFARALALQPRVVFLDEPSSGLDPVIASRIDEVILKLHRERPATFFVISHDIESAKHIADHVGILHGGRLALFQRAEEFWRSEDPIVRQLLERRPHGPITSDEEPARQDDAVDSGQAPKAQERAG